MKILITNSPLHFTHGHTLTQADWQTLVLPTLASIVGESKHQLRLVDNMTGIVKSNCVMENVRDFDPDVIAFSIIAGRDIFNTIAVIEKVRKTYPNKIILAGGQGGSFYDDLLLKSGVNCVVRGEGEQTLSELVQAIENGVKDFSAINGVSFYKDGAYCKTPERQKIKKLDDTPFPAVHLMPPRKSLWFAGRLTGSIETSRGCPFDCNFCAITSFWDRSFRRKSPERIVAEMEVLSKMGRTHIYMADDNFGMGTKHHTELFELILKKGLDVRFFAQMRTDTIGDHPEMIKLAAKAGLYGALIGFDTYDEDTFHHITKVGSVELNQKCTDVLRKNKIMIFGSHIYALPSQKEPLEFSKTFWKGRRNSDLFRMPHFSLLPGTKLYADTITEETIANAKHKDDFRMLIRPEKEMKKFRRWYTIFNMLHIFLPDEIFKTFFHPNPNVRTIKRRGYIGIARHWFYKYARKFGIVEI